MEVAMDDFIKGMLWLVCPIIAFCVPGLWVYVMFRLIPDIKAIKAKLGVEDDNA